MDQRPSDLDTARAAVEARDLTPDASNFITYEIAMHLPFDRLGEFKNLLKRFFSRAAWTSKDRYELSMLVTEHVSEGWWEHDLGDDLRLAHGIREGDYVIWVSGGSDQTAGPSVFERVFAGPVIPEPTPHPRKVKFTVGGTPEPGTWFRRTDGNPEDPRAARLLAEADVTDVMVAGDFVTVGLDRNSSWEDRLDSLLDLVTELFVSDTSGTTSTPVRTRDELLDEARRVHLDVRPSELHLLDPDDPAERRQLDAALAADDARLRRVAVAVLAESDDPDVRRTAVRTGFADDARIVRRVAIDAAAEADDEGLRELFEDALGAEDSWIRWKAVRSLGELGAEPSRRLIAPLADDDDFQVRFEVARVLRL